MKGTIILKGLLLYTTIIAIVLYICAVESLLINGYLLISTLIVIGLIYSCKKTLTKQDINTLTFNQDED